MSQQSVPPRDRATVTRMKDVKVIAKDMMKGMKLRERNGRKPKTSINFATNKTNVLPALVTTRLVIAQQDINPRQPPLTGQWIWQSSKKGMTKNKKKERSTKNNKRKEREANQRAQINKVFEKIEHFDGSNPNRCLPWLEQIHAMSNNYDRDYREELLLNSGGSVTKITHNIDVNATQNK